jgi:thiol-disulfide isomerase/thioredoxin
MLLQFEGGSFDINSSKINFSKFRSEALMNRIYFTLIFLGFFISLNLKAQEIKVITFKELDSMTHQNNDTTYIFNLWASWCKPCVAELPNFVKLDSVYSSKKVKVVFISMNFKKELETQLKPFVANHKIKQDVYLLSDPDANSWIDKLDKSWSGGIPASLIVNNRLKVRKFYEKDFTFAELEEIINQIIK